MSWVTSFELIGPEEAPERLELVKSEEIPFTEVDVDYVRQVEGLRPESWTELPLSDRLHSLQELEVRLADIEGRTPVEVRMDALGPGQFGYYDSARNVIVISENSVAEDVPYEAIDTVAHEGRHAYQHAAVAAPGIHSDPVEVAVWKDNFESYLTAELYGYEAYRNQSVERDAWAFGDSLCNLFRTPSGNPGSREGQG